MNLQMERIFIKMVSHGVWHILICIYNLKSMSQNTSYNNQINARAVIGQSAVDYCASKPTEISRVFLIII